jgi:segregation and condensation protein B
VERRIRTDRADLARGESSPRLSRAVRLAEALIFAAPGPLSPADLAARLPEGSDLDAVMAALARRYEGAGIQLAKVAGGYVFRTAPDLAAALAGGAPEPRKLSRAALETLAIVAYHQPVTRAEIEEVRGVSTSKGTLDVLLEAGWIRLRGRRKTPGRPVTYGTTPAFLEHFGLDAVADLPGLEELRGSGFLDNSSNVTIPNPSDDAALSEDEEPLAEGDSGEAG